MFGSNGLCPTSEYYLPCNILDPVFYSCDQPYHQFKLNTPSTDYSSSPENPDLISDLMRSADPLASPSDVSSCSYGEDNQHSLSPPDFVDNTGDAASIRKTRSKLIKEGLKLTIQSKRIISGLSIVRYEYPKLTADELTPEDEDRRRRRRERNKMAATKCRNKKKERTGRLAVESESLEVDNGALRREIHTLEQERKSLSDILKGHKPYCDRSTPVNLYTHLQRTTWPSTIGS